MCYFLALAGREKTYRQSVNAMAGIFGRMPPYTSNTMSFPPAGFEYFNPEPQQYGKSVYIYFL